MTRVVVFQQAPQENLGTLNDIFRASGLAVQVAHLYADVPKSMDWSSIIGLVVLGGPMNVDETRTYPFLKKEIQWIQQALTCQVPILGICLGAQLLAKTLGARVYPNAVKEIGWYDIHLTEASGDDALFLGLPGELVTFQWHGDTFDLPQGAVLLAFGPQCRHQAFRFGTHAWGLQFHPEMTVEMIDAWLSHPENAKDLSLFPDDRAETIRSKTPVMMRHYRTWTTTVLERFADCCTRRKSVS
ncbi:MAG: type 1 glutamine amidotransferase [Thermogutta sp.]